jgi:sarcosine oxidase subunit gamma
VANSGQLAFAPGRIGKRDVAPGVSVREHRGRLLASLVARRGTTQALAAATERSFGVRLPTSPRVVAASGSDGPVSFIGSGPAQWLIESGAGSLTVEELQSIFADTASVFEQSDSRLLLDVSGPRVRDTLAKGLPIDLDPVAFKPGDAAITTANHISVQIWQLSGEPVYRLAVPRSYFGSFWHWLAMSAAEYGCEIIAPD